ncbi:MAG TPA: 4Fe-4S dicluster domain-containing protein [Candidatus Polarisedimenticolia bacterium]|nr:4Fe-4S dicluster domain-containing protein [Candidatus Polarisedimenticolia bacterium]
MTRRDILTLLGASISLAGLAACRRPVQHIVPYVDPPEQVIPGVPKHYATTMPFGRAAYGLVVESHEGHPTKIEGNPKHPGSLGASSVRTQASILDLYDPDRGQHLLASGQPKKWPDFVAAWKEIEKAHLADGGAGLAILSQSFASPTLARLRSVVLNRFPKATWATWEPASDENVLAGVKAATGRDLEPHLQVEKARIIVALDADLFLLDPESIRNSRGFAAGRKAGSTGGVMNRLYAVEAAYSVTGTMADHRLRLPAGRIAAFAAALARAVGVPGAPPGADGLDERGRRFLNAVVSDLKEARGQGLVVAGPRQPAAVHAAVAALNLALGNAGTTVVYREPLHAALPSLASLTALKAKLDAGAVATLVVLGGNPAFDAPADMKFAEAMARAKERIVVGDRVDETASGATWSIPRAHFLEAWGDARDASGTLSVVQPLILPLYEAKSDVEVLALLGGGADEPGYDVVRLTWKSILGEADFDRKWNRVLHDGLLAGSETAPVTAAAAARPFGDLETVAAAAPNESGMEILFQPSNAVHDGRFANNGWLQELPDPVTKITWDNPALLSPKTAKSLGVANEDVVRLEHDGRTLELPAFIVPGQADGTVVVTLGYGRRHAGRVGTGVGFDAYRLRGSAAPWIASGARVSRTGKTALLASTQEHGSMEGHPLVLEGTVEEFRRKPDFARELAEAPHEEATATTGETVHGSESGHGVEHKGPTGSEKGGVTPGGLSLFKEKIYDDGPQWGMTIDLNTCVGCNACIVACQSENNVPVVGKDQVRRSREMHWLRLDRYFTGDVEGDAPVVMQPLPCMQCENAPCEQVCPVAATVHDDEGLNVMAYNRCIGTRYCSNNCPYKVRRFNFFLYQDWDTPTYQLMRNPDVSVRSRGVMEKCTYCVQRIQGAKIQSEIEGRKVHDGEIVTACQSVCPTEAIVFGDVNDPNSKVSKLKALERDYSLLGDLNTRPRTTYLSALRNPNPEIKG